LEDAGVSAEVSATFCAALAKAAFPGAAKKGAGAGAAKVDSSAADADLLCRLKNLMMMYGGSAEPLLRNATLEFVKGHRYGVVGSNGSGKSTLMGKIARKEIVGFPETIRIAHLSHDKILQGVDPSTTAREYTRQRSGEADVTSDEAVARALAGVGFGDEMLEKAVAGLSGGWQMRLALACAVAQKANLLLLDEATNHLDVAGVQWLVEFINGTCIGGESGGTAMIISHDEVFLDQVCSDVIQFTSDGKLLYHAGNFGNFKATVLRGDENEAQKLLESGSMAAGFDAAGGSMLFPAPDKIGTTSAARKEPVMTLQNANVRYGEGPPVLSDIHVKMHADSRIVIVGENGAGKSTLLAMLADRLKPSPPDPDMPPGELWWHKSLRVAYIAQQHLVHLGEHLSSSPREYMQWRFRQGWDVESPEKAARTLTASEESDRKRAGTQFGKKSKPIQALLSRKEVLRHGGAVGEKEFKYEVQWEGLSDAERTWEGLGKILQCGCRAMQEDLDERLWQAWAGVEQRELSTEEVVFHLKPFGLPQEVVCNRKISMLSSGQKIKLMFGAAFWTRPHLLLLDEPTNYLDVESVALLQEALKAFRGGYAVVTHNADFAAGVAEETWTVAGGKVEGAKKIWGNKAAPKGKATPKVAPKGKATPK